LIQSSNEFKFNLKIIWKIYLEKNKGNNLLSLNSGLLAQLPLR